MFSTSFSSNYYYYYLSLSVNMVSLRMMTMLLAFRRSECRAVIHRSGATQSLQSLRQHQPPVFALSFSSKDSSDSKDLPYMGPPRYSIQAGPDERPQPDLLSISVTTNLANIDKLTLQQSN